jgi:hypothetical protein
LPFPKTVEPTPALAEDRMVVMMMMADDGSKGSDATRLLLLPPLLSLFPHPPITAYTQLNPHEILHTYNAIRKGGRQAIGNASSCER